MIFPEDRVEYLDLANDGRIIMESPRLPNEYSAWRNFVSDDLVLVTADHRVEVWNISTGTRQTLAVPDDRQWAPPLFARSAFDLPSWESHDRLLLKSEESRIWDRDSKGLVWNLVTNQIDCEITYSDVLEEMQFSPDGSRILFAGFHPDVHIYDARTGQLAQTLNGHKNGNTGSFSPDGRTIFSISGKTARLWNAATGLEMVQLDARQIAIPHFHSPGFTPDGNGLYAYLGFGVASKTTYFRFLTLPTLEEIDAEIDKDHTRGR